MTNKHDSKYLRIKYNTKAAQINYKFEEFLRNE